MTASVNIFHMKISKFIFYQNLRHKTGLKNTTPLNLSKTICKECHLQRDYTIGMHLD